MTFREKYLKSDTWQDKTHAINVWHHLMIHKYGKWTIRRTAKYFKISIGTVSEALKLAGNMELVKNCATRKGALEKLNGDK